MAKPNIRAGKAKVKLQARRVRRDRLLKDASETIELVKATGIAHRQGVLILILDLGEGDITGYTNVDPVIAALALVEYLERTYPRAERAVAMTRADAPRRGRSRRNKVRPTR